MATRNAACHIQFKALPGFFYDFAAEFQNDPCCKATTLPGLGLIERSYEADGIASTDDTKPWERFKNYVDYLNGRDSESATYKVLYITRHGLAHHNTYEAQVGRDAWNNHWSHLDGDGTIVWADAHLNDEGIKQAETLSQLWSDAISLEKVPIPGTLYTSPLARTLETTYLAFSRIYEARQMPFRPVVKEYLRELLTDHTCDRRRSRTWIEKNYPEYVLEQGFSEADKLWTGGNWESAEDHTARKHAVLENIFSTDENAFIGLTTHSYAISAILRAVGAATFRVREGSSIALLVKAERVRPGKA